MASLSTMVWAKLLGGTTVFDMLPSGAKFKFPGNPSTTVLVKGKNGWYTDMATMKKYRTGGGTAVVLITLPVVTVL